MDVHLRANAQHCYGVNGGAGRTSRASEDRALQFLSQDVQECLLFFEETIDSLEESLEEGAEPRQQALGGAASAHADSDADELDRPPCLPTAPTLSSSPAPPSPLPHPRDHDIIDLVRPDPDLVPTKETVFDPTTPDFGKAVKSPNSLFEVKTRRDPADLLPSEYNPPLPGCGTSDGNSSYCPPGCIPTPVLIAQKLAENQGSGTSNLPSSLHHRRSLDSDRPVFLGSEHTVKQGPPTSVKPSRFPSNISVMLGSKEPQNQSLANVNINERRAKMLANLPGTPHILGQEEVQYASQEKERNTPTRSVSFRDPTPDKSRMEALSKLGLCRSRAMSGGISVSITPQSATSDSTPPNKDPESSDKSPTADHSNRPCTSESTSDRKQDAGPIDSIGRSVEKPLHSNPSPLTPELGPVSPPPEFASTDFNSYGGKTVVINPGVSSKGDTLAPPDSPDVKAALGSPSNLNAYGGKSRVMTPSSPVPVARSDLPDILSAHIDKNLSAPPPARQETHPVELNSFGGKTRTITPSTSSNSPARSPKPPAPSPAPKPLRHHVSLNLPRPVARPVSPEPRRKSMSKATVFRPQGITVQFSGRGATDESRRDALRKLGLLKDTC